MAGLTPQDIHRMAKQGWKQDEGDRVDEELGARLTEGVEERRELLEDRVELLEEREEGLEERDEMLGEEDRLGDEARLEPPDDPLETEPPDLLRVCWP